jgi:adenylate cyclase
MKRCPECRRDYYDDTLLYCLDDGNALLEGPASGSGAADEPKTAILPSFYSEIEPTTQVFQIYGAHDPPPKNTIAVLPFLNLNPETESEYFSDGLSEELINVLSKIPRLRVAARTSAFSFKKKQTTVVEIGRILNVASVLEGSVRKAGQRVRISVQLVKVEDGFQLWSKSYDRTIDDIFAVQDDIAQSVVEELQGLLLGREPEEKPSAKVISEVASAIKGRSSDPEAQRLMLLGRYFLDRTTKDDTEKAIGCFREALDLDPDFSLCWAELSHAFAIEAGSGWIKPEEGFEMARSAATHALEIEPDLAEAHALQGRIKASYDWDPKGAEESYRRALELAPGSSAVLDGASILALRVGKVEDALELSRRVVAQDPLSAAVWHNLGLACHVAGLLDDAEAAFRRSYELAPHRVRTKAMLGVLLADMGRIDEALEESRQETEGFWRTWALSIVNHKAGKRADADSEFAAFMKEYSAGDPFQTAEIFAVRGEADEAFRWLERAVAERDPGVTHVKIDPRFENLYDDERWPKLVSKIGF